MIKNRKNGDSSGSDPKFYDTLLINFTNHSSGDYPFIKLLWGYIP